MRVLKRLGIVEPGLPTPSVHSILHTVHDLTGIFCTSGSEREFTLEGSWYADQEIQAGADRDAAAAG